MQKIVENNYLANQRWLIEDLTLITKFLNSKSPDSENLIFSLLIPSKYSPNKRDRK
jgi:hypothetical protein